MAEPLDLGELAKFLVRAKRSTFAGQNARLPAEQAELPGFKELEYPTKDGPTEPFYYRDHYVGSLAAPGLETVRLADKNGPVIWTMAYHGGMQPHDDDAAPETFKFLKKALSQVPENMPFRGPRALIDGKFMYLFSPNGNIEYFSGREQIYYNQDIVFFQDIIGGIVQGKERHKFV